jgi:molybdopterin-synthase adenylyltransferase
MRIVFAQEEWAATRAGLLDRLDVESCAIALGRECSGRLIVREVRCPGEADYIERSSVSAQLSPEFIFEAVSRARLTQASLVFIHTHPGDPNVPVFSPIDDAGERRLQAFINRRLPAGDHGSIVVSPGGVSARVLGSTRSATVVSAGRKFHVENGPFSKPANQFDRQVRAFGAEGQAAIAAAKVAVVGVGGTGSLTIQQLAHLGIRNFLLIDFDLVDPTSLNRLVGTVPDDIGTSKIEIAARAIKAINPAAEIRVVAGDIADDHIAKELLDRDVIFGCTDSHASRAILGQVAYQYLIPVIDMGVSISVRNGILSKITGRAQLLAPGLPCFACLELLNSETIRREMLTPEQRAADRYIEGAREPQPSVISLNATMSSLAVTMFLGLVTAAPLEATFLRYDGIKGLVRPMAGATDPECYVCSASNGFARADEWPLPTRSGQA